MARMEPDGSISVIHATDDGTEAGRGQGRRRPLAGP
jgi:hypothetical protein